METRDKKARELGPVPDIWPWWDGTPLPSSPLLRWGYTTGAAATAALVASFREMQAKRSRDAAGNVSFGHVEVRFGDGKTRKIPLSPERADYPGYVCVRKNGGDDPDCTHGIEILAKIVPESPEAARDMESVPCGPADIALTRGRARVRLHGLCGVGLATRPGLDCADGHWAINYGTQAMILDNLEAAGMRDGSWAALLAIPEGAEKAKSTLNGTLGVVGGLSLLGTTGLVRPFSHEAYISSIRTNLRQARLLNPTIFLGTGTRTLKTAKAFCQESPCAFLHEVPETSFVSMADFFAESLEAAARLDFERIVVVCMPGKLLKMAAGFDNTHAHKNAQNMGLLAEVFMKATGHATALDAAASMREAMGLMNGQEQKRVLEALAGMALDRVEELVRDKGDGDRTCEGKSGGAKGARRRCGILLAGFAGEVLDFFACEGFFD